MKIKTNEGMESENQYYKKWDKHHTFYQPVNDVIAPNYSIEIKKSMDLLTMDKKLKSRE